MKRLILICVFLLVCVVGCASAGASQSYPGPNKVFLPLVTDGRPQGELIPTSTPSLPPTIPPWPTNTPIPATSTPTRPESYQAFHVTEFWVEDDGTYASVIFGLSSGKKIGVQFKPVLLEPFYSVGSGFGEVQFGDIIFRMVREDKSWVEGVGVTGLYTDWDDVYRDVVNAQTEAWK